MPSCFCSRNVMLLPAICTCRLLHADSLPFILIACSFLGVAHAGVILFKNLYIKYKEIFVQIYYKIWEILFFFLSLISTVCDNICVISLYLSPSLISWDWSMVNRLALEYNFFFLFLRLGYLLLFFPSKKWEFFLWIFFDLVLNYLFSKFMHSWFLVFQNLSKNFQSLAEKYRARPFFY